jgi:hypothetical protein
MLYSRIKILGNRGRFLSPFSSISPTHHSILTALRINSTPSEAKFVCFTIRDMRLDKNAVITKENHGALQIVSSKSSSRRFQG